MPRIMNDGEAVELWAVDNDRQLTTADICTKCALFDVQNKRKTFAEYPQLKEKLELSSGEPLGDCITFLNPSSHEPFEASPVSCELCGKELTKEDN